MFCNEPIINVYAGRSEVVEADSFLDCYHNNSINFHLTNGYRYVLETEHYYITLDVDGVKLDEKQCSIAEYEEKDEWLESFYQVIDDAEFDDIWVEYEYTLFVGEHLVDVKKSEKGYIAVFDDFSVNIVPHSLSDIIPKLQNHMHYLHSYGCERLIKRKCQCGGTGELLLDFVEDYIVRCNKCHISTWAGMNAIDAIEDWNSGETEVDSSDIIIE